MIAKTEWMWAGNRTYNIVCYCLIANVHGDAKDSIFGCICSIAHIIYVAMCMCICVYVLSWDEARCHHRRDTFVVAPLRFSPHAQCTTTIVIAVVVVLFFALSHTVNRIDRISMHFNELVVLTVCASDVPQKNNEWKSMHTICCYFFYVVFYMCNNSSMYTEHCHSISPFLFE